MGRIFRGRQPPARWDPLTGLASRAAVESALAAHIEAHATGLARAASPGGPDQSSAGTADPDRGRVGLLVIDLDRFRQVNTALGHPAGDRVLVAVGRRLCATVRAGDLVARLGGDEFAVVVPGLPDIAAARTYAAQIVRALAAPVTLDGLPVELSGSVGVAVYPEHGADATTLLRHADVARYDAKQRADSVAVYVPGSDHSTPERMRLLADLRRALHTGDSGIALYYQPQVDIATGAVVGLEALLRWRHPRHGEVDPQELIRVAEHTPVMRLLTRRVVDEVLAQVARWGTAVAGLRVSVNVSVRDLHDATIADWVAARLAAHGVPPARLQLEITEGALMADSHRVLATVTRLHRLGVSIALDDFGTGYSSMLHLRRLPLSEVKIDRAFVLGASGGGSDAAIVRSLISLARELGIRAVAEGVEDLATWRLLASAGCHVAQGWYCARPMPPSALLSWLARSADARGSVAPGDGWRAGSRAQRGQA